MTMGFRDDREALEAKLRAQEHEIEALRAEVEELREPPVSAAPSDGSNERRKSARELRQLAQRQMNSTPRDDAPLAFLPWWVHLLAYGAVAVLAIMIAIRDCGG